MTDTPSDEVLIEAARRLKICHITMGIDGLRRQYRTSPGFRIMADTLVELGWKPPIDPLLAEAREIAAKTMDEEDDKTIAEIIRGGSGDNGIFVQIAMAGIRRGMEMGRD